jgi:hypothetical protein
LAKTNVTQGENIAAPTITCSAGTLNKSAATFSASSGTTPTDVNNWRNTGNAYYGGTVTGNNTITVAGVTCGGTAVAGNTSCGTIAVAKPTCSGVSGSVFIGATITPTVGCGNATLSGNPTFDGGTGWTSSGSGGSYSSTGSKTISLSSVTCDNHAITSITGVSCGTVTVNALPTATCTFSPTSYTVGQSVNAPTISCSSGTVDKTSATFTKVSGIDAQTPANWISGSTTYASAGSSQYKISGVKCGGTTVVDANCTALTISTATAESTCGAYTGNNAAGKTWADICPSTAWDDVKWNQRPTKNGNRVPQGCYFVQDFTGDQYNIQSTVTAWRINGTQFSSQSDIRSAANTKIDGGIYIYVPNGNGDYIHNEDKMIPGNSSPFCVDGVHALTCPAISPAQVVEGTAVTVPTPVCRSGETPSITSWTGAPNWANPAEGTYNVNVSGTCGSSGPLTGSCGSLEVMAAGSVINVSLNYDTPYTFEVGKTYNLTCQTQVRTLYCYSLNATDASLTIGSTTKTIPGWATSSNMSNNWGNCTNGQLTVNKDISCTHKY